MKYGTWNVSSYRPADVRVMVEAGFSPLTAAVMCSRGYTELNEARDFLAANEPLSAGETRRASFSIFCSFST